MKGETSRVTGYSERFRDPAAVENYEAKEYAPDSYSSCLWQMERPVLERVLADFRRGHASPLRLLDFACGTGRILSVVENLADVAQGIDISQSMVAVARKKCSRAQLLVGDILAEPGLLKGPYHVITCFRFILNVESTVRSRVLRELRRVISEPDGLLVVSVHGNSRSARHPAIAWKRRRVRNDAGSGGGDVMLNEMSPGEARQLLSDCGFEVVEQLGFGMVPPTLYRTPLRRLAVAADKFFADKQWARERAVDMIFICRPRPVPGSVSHS